jgi:hypothetical protein
MLSKTDDFFIPGFLATEDRESFKAAGIHYLELIKFIEWEEERLKEFLHELPGKSSNRHLFAYSMGGRFLLQNYEIFRSYFSKIYLMGCFIGCLERGELHQRVAFEEKTLSLLREGDQGEFLSFWNSLPLFGNDPVVDLPYSLEQLYALFDRMRLSRLKPIDASDLDKGQVRFIYGEKDIKYRELYLRHCSDHTIIELKDRYHRLNTVEIVSLIKELDYA